MKSVLLAAALGLLAVPSYARFIDSGNDRTDEVITCPPLNGVIPD